MKHLSGRYCWQVPVPCSTFPFWEGPLASPERAAQRLRFIEAYRSYDPAVVQQAAQARVAEAQGDKISLDLRGQQVTFSGLKAVQQATAELTEMASGMISQLGGSGDRNERWQKDLPG